jgi:hypothetical protein
MGEDDMVAGRRLCEVAALHVGLARLFDLPVGL